MLVVVAVAGSHLVVALAVDIEVVVQAVDTAVADIEAAARVVDTAVLVALAVPVVAVVEHSQPAAPD